MDKIYILDFGGQYTHLIANRVRRLNVYSEIVGSNTPIKKLKEAKGIILSGGPHSVYEKNAPKYDKKLFSSNKPVLGLCYGHQLMAKALGGEVKKRKMREYGSALVCIKNHKRLFLGLNEEEQVWMSHGDSVTELPKNFEIIASTDDIEIAGMACFEKNYYGLQFHPEVTHTAKGMKILENFINICDCKREWTTKNFIEEKIIEIRTKALGKKVLMLVSGGVDSSVAFTLLTKALGKEKVHGIYVDNGLMRKNETKLIKKTFEELDFNINIVDASEEFLSALRKATHPETKRKIIGRTFVKVARKHIKSLGLSSGEWLLGQGTIYPDVIETAGSKEAALIKTHHNRVEEIQELIKKNLIIEPLNQLYKDEVRALGLKLGMSKTLVNRHPFPGPGLGVRVLCSQKKVKIKNEKRLNEEIDYILSQFDMRGFVLPIKSVGVQGDSRSYKHPAIVIGKLNWETLEGAATLITNSLKEINRAIYMVNTKGFTQKKEKKAFLTRERISLLREADHIVMKSLKQAGLYNNVWQCPTVLIPFSLGQGSESIVIRAVDSTEAMTARFSMLPTNFLFNLSKKLLELKDVSAVFYDITNKPPGTIEWE